LALLTGPPVTMTSPGAMLESPSSAVRTAAAFAFCDRGGRLAVERERERADRGGDAHGLRLVGLHVVVRREAA